MSLTEPRIGRLGYPEDPLAVSRRLPRAIQIVRRRSRLIPGRHGRQGSRRDGGPFPAGVRSRGPLAALRRVETVGGSLRIPLVRKVPRGGKFGCALAPANRWRSEFPEHDSMARSPKDVRAVDRFVRRRSVRGSTEESPARIRTAPVGVQPAGGGASATGGRPLPNDPRRCSSAL